jgi:hypothetical protein
VHPWELVDRGCPGTFTGLARFFHEAGRAGYQGRFEDLVQRLAFHETLAEAVGVAHAIDLEARAQRSDLDETWAAAAPTEVA